MPFVIPEYLFNFASMNRARSAGLTLPYLLNVSQLVLVYVVLDSN